MGDLCIKKVSDKEYSLFADNIYEIIEAEGEIFLMIALRLQRQVLYFFMTEMTLVTLLQGESVLETIGS